VKKEQNIKIQYRPGEDRKTQKKDVLTPREKRVKRELENLLRKHGYRRDDRPDHREWDKFNPAFNTKIRLDQNNPEGFNGFSFELTTYTRWNIEAKDIEAILAFFKGEFQ
jgi:hypothetical protein